MDIKPAQPDHANNFHFLRFALATSVILGHSFELLRRRDPFECLFGYGARLGVASVSGFFLISGCLIVASWQRSSSLQSYLSKRCWRIYPGFVVASLVSVLIVGPLGGNPNYWAELSCWPFLAGLPLLAAPTTPRIFSGQLVPVVNGSMWTIHYEFVCYLIVAALGLVGLLARRRSILALTGLTLAAYVAQVQLGNRGYRVDQILPEQLTVLPQLLGCFLVGACAHLYPIRFTWRGSLVAAALFVAATRCGYTVTQTALPLAGGYILFTLAAAPSRLMRAWNRFPDVSYGLYLYAWPCQVLLIHWFPTIHPITLFAGAFAMSLIAGTASWYGVERWFVRSRPWSVAMNRLFPAQPALATST